MLKHWQNTGKLQEICQREKVKTMEIWCQTLHKIELQKILEKGGNTGKVKEICQSDKEGTRRKLQLITR